MAAVIIGYAPYHIPIYANSDYFDKNEIINKGRQGSKYAGVVYGMKYQCVELARRWLIHARNLTFAQVPDATDIFNLKYATDILTHKKVPFIRILNNGTNTPEFGDIIIWKKQRCYKNHGHVAIVSKVISPAIVTIAEQNWKTKHGIRNINVHQDIILGWMRPDL